MKFIFGTIVHWGNKNPQMTLFLWKPCYHGNKSIYQKLCILKLDEVHIWYICSLGNKNPGMILLLRKPYFHGNKNIHEYFVFYSQVKFIFGTLGKRKSINYLVAMETLSPCYSPVDVFICCICSLGQKKSDIRKSPRSRLYGGNLSPSIVIQISLESSNFPPDIVLYTLHSYSRKARGQPWMHVAQRAKFKNTESQSIFKI